MFRKRQYILLLLGAVLLFGLGVAGHADDGANYEESIPVNYPVVNSAISNSNIPINYVPKMGETLEYDVWVKSILGGKQTLTILGQEKIRDRTVLKVQYQLKTIGLAWHFTKYRATEELVLDLNGLYPLSIRQEIRQGTAISIEENDFDYEKGVFSRTYAIDGIIKENYERKLSGFIHDTVSLQLYLRKGEYQRGVNKLLFYENGKVEEIEYKVSEVNRPLVLKAGTFAGYYQVDYNNGRIVILLSKEDRIPLIIRINSPYMGKIEAKLIKIR